MYTRNRHKCLHSLIATIQLSRVIHVTPDDDHRLRGVEATVLTEEFYVYADRSVLRFQWESCSGPAVNSSEDDDKTCNNDGQRDGKGGQGCRWSLCEGPPERPTTGVSARE